VVDQYLDQHIEFLEKYYALGKFVVSGRKVPRSGGVIIVNAKSSAELDDIIKEDPFYKAGVSEYEVTEFLPAMAAKEFSGFID
jgi:uncharacterized protein YciI